ncbi:unnamed protein product, partial [Candidula unifasciata]
MVKFMTASSVFKFTWDQVASGMWQRYPNPNSKHVLTEDVLSRRIEDQKLVSLRILTKTNKIPKWGERFVGQNKNILIIEESVVDPKEKTFTTYTRNVGLQKVLLTASITSHNLQFFSISVAGLAKLKSWALPHLLLVALGFSRWDQVPLL